MLQFPLMRRFFKQFLYLIFYLAILSGLVFLIWERFFRPAPSCTNGYKDSGEEEIDCGGSCEPCALRHLKPIKTNQAELIYGGEDYKATIFEVINPNLDWGADRFDYKLDFINADGSIAGSAIGDSFIYPGEVKKIVVVGLDFDTRNVIKTNLSVDGFYWKNREVFSIPKTGLREVKYNFDDKTKRVLVTGIFTNEEPLPLSYVNIVVSIKDSLGLSVGGSETILENVSEFGERDFLITMPISDFSTLSRESIKVFASSKK